MQAQVTDEQYVEASQATHTAPADFETWLVERIHHTRELGVTIPKGTPERRIAAARYFEAVDILAAYRKGTR
jgi:hypothetical protein